MLPELSDLDHPSRLDETELRELVGPVEVDLGERVGEPVGTRVWGAGIDPSLFRRTPESFEDQVLGEWPERFAEKVI